MMNASNTMIRKASELDTGNAVIVGGVIRKVAEVRDLHLEAGVYVGITFDNGGYILDRASTLYTCVCQ